MISLAQVDRVQQVLEDAGGIYLNATEREHVRKLIANYHVGPDAAATIRKILGY